MKLISKALLVIVFSLQIFSISGQTYLRADGKSDTYTLINNVLGNGALDVPDCKHKVKHITMGNDGQLKRPVFQFLIHVNEDDDTCSHTDRQRTEIKTHNGSPDDLKGFEGETVYLSWNMKLDSGFQVSNGFTHLYQLKDVGGADGTPIMTISARKGSPDKLEISHVGSDDKKTNLGVTDLTPFKGIWVHIRQEATYSSSGKYNVTITRVSDGKSLFTVAKANLDMWRSGAKYVRPKWGIYRSLTTKNQLRDETVLFDTFCLAKGSTRCT